MNEQQPFESTVAQRIEEERRSATLPESFYDEFTTRANAARQRPRWLVLIKEPPMRTNSHLAYGSPTVRIAAIMTAMVLLVLTLVGAGVAGRQIFAADGPIIVDPSGAGTYTTITEAVAAASDGDEIVVRAGEYAETVSISDAITLRGEDRDSVIVEVGLFCVDDEETEVPVCEDDVPMVDRGGDGYPYGFLLQGSDATIGNLTFRFSSSGYGLLIDGGAPRLEDILYDDDVGGSSLDVFGGSNAVIDGFDAEEMGCCTWIYVMDGSPVTIMNSKFDAVFANTEVGGSATIRGNEARGIFFRGTALIEDNTITSRTMSEKEPSESEDDFLGINVEGGEGWVVRGNHVTGFTGLGAAIEVADGSTGTIEDNTLTDNRVGIAIPGDADIVGNTIANGETDNSETAISLTGGAPRLIDNTVEGMSGAGISVVGPAAPTLSGNRSCDNGTDLQLVGDAQPKVDTTNEICQEQPTDTIAGAPTSR